MTIDKLILEFLEYMEIEKGCLAATSKNYDHYLRTFSNFAKQSDVGDPQKITLDLITKYRLSMNRAKNPISKSTQNYYLIALRSFLKYLSKKNIVSLPFNKIELAKTSERQVTFLNHDELDNLFSKTNLKTLHGKRDRAILNLFFSTGLRVSELANLKKKDINLETGEFSIKGKGGKVRVVFIDEVAKISLKQYLNARNDKSDFLFVPYGHSDKKITDNLQFKNVGITPRSIQRMIKKYAISAGMTKKVTPHILRHSFATDLLQSGADLRAVQKLLGHSSVVTTEIYTHVTDQHLKEVHQAFHGLRRKQPNPAPGAGKNG